MKKSRAVRRASEFQIIKALHQKYKTELDDEGYMLQDFSKWVPQLVTPEDMGIRSRSDDDMVESRHQAHSEVTVHLTSAGIATIPIMSKKEARAAGYVKGDEEYPSTLTVDVETR